MFAFVLGLILALLGAVAALTGAAASRRARTSHSSEDTSIRNGAWGTSAVLALIAAVLVFLSMFATVGTQDVGILTSFGRPAGVLGNGGHLKAPWEHVTAMDNAVQTDVYEGKNCIPIRIADQQTACAKVRIQWQMLKAAADRLYRNYRTSDGVRTSLVTSELGAAMNSQFSVYNPIGRSPPRSRPERPATRRSRNCRTKCWHRCSPRLVPASASTR